MIFCIDNAEKSEEIIKCIVESLSITETPLSKIVSLINMRGNIFIQIILTLFNF